ncbi:MAG: M6 family metalloprotease domain-containing protein [Muribaculaceae bacterium]|nr:M6 family metalloprotease domain-containing protein [Muribaculaceae bacterium]
MKRTLLLMLALSAYVTMLWSVPARPGVVVLPQSDGGTVSVRLLGDEWHSRLVTASDGFTVGRDAQGDVYYKLDGKLTHVRCHDASMRTADEQAFVAANREALMAGMAETLWQTERRASAAPRRVGSTQVPVTGQPRIPILLVQYTDKAMANPKEAFVQQYTQGPSSAYQYFVDQSWGQYEPQFDVFGIYTLPKTRATYGAHGYRSGREVNDVGVGQMVCDAITAAGDDVDWSPYDNDGDGQVDVCIVVYAGVGEAQGYVDDSVWPCQWNLMSASFYDDGDGPQWRNGKRIDRFAVFNELRGRDDNGSQLDGVGTFCHEFSHCLGLPDFYETTYDHGYYGMGNWSVMCGGCYNNDSYTPCGYTAYERAFMGWMQLTEAQANTRYTLSDIALPDAQAVKITNDRDANEYYILENRQLTGWNAYMASEGLMVTHVTYNATAWQRNKVNNDSVQRMTIIAADGLPNDSTEQGDLYPWCGNNRLTDDSTPPAVAHTGGRMGKPVTNITLSNGLVTFDFMRTATVVGDLNNDGFADIDDINIVINIVLGNYASDELRAASDLDGNGTVDVADINALINIVLGVNE